MTDFGIKHRHQYTSTDEGYIEKNDRKIAGEKEERMYKNQPDDVSSEGNLFNLVICEKFLCTVV